MTQQCASWLLQPCLDSWEIRRKGAACCLLAGSAGSSSCANTQGQENKHVAPWGSHPQASRVLTPCNLYVASRRHLLVKPSLTLAPVGASGMM